VDVAPATHADIQPVASVVAAIEAPVNDAPIVANAVAHSEPVAVPVVQQAPYTSVAPEERVVEFTPPQSAIEPVEVEKQSAPVIPAAPIAREPIVLPSDLVQIETDAEKLRIATGKLPSPPLPRPPRVRPPIPAISNEPLIQVETNR
jgi:ribonuclease E